MASRATEWVADYIRAWETNDPGHIAALFTEQAVYRTAPDSPPRRGRREIVDGWIADADEPGEWSFDWHVEFETSDFAVVQGRTDYPARADDFINLWVIRFAVDGRATEFTEWYMRRPHAAPAPSVDARAAHQ